MQKDRDRAKAYLEAANNGDVMAMNNLGVCYQETCSPICALRSSCRL